MGSSRPLMGKLEASNGNLRCHYWEISMTLVGMLEDIAGGNRGH